MTKLDQLEKLKKFNQGRVADSFLLLPEQLMVGWLMGQAVSLPASWRSFGGVVCCGMGGSNLASELVYGVYGPQIKVPFFLVRYYNLPAFVGPDTLVIISSYSGDTEEPLFCLRLALKAKAKIICLTAGGQLLSASHKHHLPLYLIDQKYNPSGQPRYGLGLQLGLLLAALSKLKLIKVNLSEIKAASEQGAILNSWWRLEVASKNNLAKALAQQLFGRLPVIVGADLSTANAHILANQLQESAKNLALNFPLPELNHHLLDGLLLPPAVSAKIKFLFFHYQTANQELKKRFAFTQAVLRQQGLEFIDYAISGPERLSAAWEFLVLGSWVSFYLAVLNGQRPEKIFWTQRFKTLLRKK